MTAEQQAKNSNMNRADRAEEELKKSRKVNKKLIAENKRLEANCQNLLSERNELLSDKNRIIQERDRLSREKDQIEINSRDSKVQSSNHTEAVRLNLKRCEQERET